MLHQLIRVNHHHVARIAAANLWASHHRALALKTSTVNRQTVVPNV